MGYCKIHKIGWFGEETCAACESNLRNADPAPSPLDGLVGRQRRSEKGTDAPDVYECAACGTTGDLNEIHHEEIDGVLICRECCGGGELCLQAELQAHNEMVEEAMKPKTDFSKALDGEIF